MSHQLISPQLSDSGLRLLKVGFCSNRQTETSTDYIFVSTACAGVVSSTEFGLIVSKLARLCLRNGSTNLRTCSKPKELAKVLKGLFDVSNGTITKIHIAGGADCAWLAAVALWLLELSVQVQDPTGEIIYRPGTTRTTDADDAQVILRYDTGPAETSSILQRSYFVPSGRMLLSRSLSAFQEEEIISHERVKWKSCLIDTFGQPMKKLLRSRAPQTGLCLGAAARIFEQIACHGTLE